MKKVVVAVRGSHSLIFRMVSVDVIQHLKKKKKVEVDVQGSHSLIVLMVSVDANQHLKKN